MFSVSLDRSLALVVMALLLAVAPVAALDLGDTMSSSRPADGTSDGRMDGPPTQTPLLTGAMNTRSVLEDPSGDTEFQFIGENPAAGRDADAPIDILSLTLAETDRALLFSLKHRDYPESEATLSGAAIMNAYCTIMFRVNGDANLTYGIGLDYLTPFGPGYTSWASLYRMEDEGDDRRPSGYYDDHITGLPAALVGGDHYEIVVPKEALDTGSEERPLRTGDRLTDFRTDCTRDSGTLFVRHTDDAADPAARYPITIASGTAELVLSLPEDGLQSLAVPVGKKTKVSVDVENLLERKVLVNLTAEVVDKEGKPLKGWAVTSAPTLEMKGEATTPATLVVSVDPSVSHRDAGILRVTAFPLGFEDKATFTVPTYAVQPLTPEHNTLFFHRGDTTSFYCGGICIGGPIDLTEVSDPNPDIFVMNVLESDPTYGQEPGEDDGVALFSTDRAWAYLDAPLGAPIRFDPDGTLGFTVALKTEVAREVAFEATIRTSEEGYLSHLSQKVELTQDFQTFTFDLPVNPDLSNVPRDGQIAMSMRFLETAQVSFTGDTWVSSVEWDPSQTQLTLPLVAVPEPEVNITDGRALPSIILGNKTDKEEYVNPGETQAFDLVLLNEGTQKDALRLTTEVSHPGWTVRFDPGNRFELQAGGSAPLCMSVAAPEDAKEGDVVNITLTATSKLDAEVKTEIDLVLLVTNYEIEPRTCSAINEEDYVKPLAEQEDSPAIGAALWLALIGLIAGAARRRSS